MPRASRRRSGACTASPWACMASVQPRRRSEASIESTGPVTCRISRCPSPIRCSVAILRPGVLVHRHPVQARRRLGGDHDERHARVDAREHADALPLPRDEHDRLDALQREPVHGLPQHLAVERAHARLRHGVAGLVRRLVEAERRVRRTVVGPPGLDQPDRPRTPLRHGAGGRRRRVRELGDGLLHADPGRRRDAREVVEHARHRLVRDAGPAGDVEHRRHAGCPGRLLRLDRRARGIRVAHADLAQKPCARR